jgi:hypothetical protein
MIYYAIMEELQYLLNVLSVGRQSTIEAKLLISRREQPWIPSKVSRPLNFNHRLLSSMRPIISSDWCHKLTLKVGNEFAQYKDRPPASFEWVFLTGHCLETVS